MSFIFIQRQCQCLTNSYLAHWTDHFQTSNFEQCCFVVIVIVFFSLETDTSSVWIMNKFYFKMEYSKDLVDVVVQKILVVSSSFSFQFNSSRSSIVIRIGSIMRVHCKDPSLNGNKQATLNRQVVRWQWERSKVFEPIWSVFAESVVERRRSLNQDDRLCRGFYGKSVLIGLRKCRNATPWGLHCSSIDPSKLMNAVKRAIFISLSFRDKCDIFFFFKKIPFSKCQKTTLSKATVHLKSRQYFIWFENSFHGTAHRLLFHRQNLSQATERSAWNRLVACGGD